MLASSYLKWSALLLVALCLVGVMSAPITGQIPQQPELYLTKDDPVISERFSQHLAKLEPQEKVKVWVFFTDKGFVDVESYRSAVTQAENTLTSRAARRRAKVMKQSLVDFRDLPVNQAYIDHITDFEAKLYRCQVYYLCNPNMLCRQNHTSSVCCCTTRLDGLQSQTLRHQHNLSEQCI